MKIVFHKTPAEALIAALTIREIWVEIIDPSQRGRAIVESKRFYTLRKAKNFVRRQLRVDCVNNYEIIRK